MSFVDLLPAEGWVEAIAHGLLHSTWQIAAVAGVLAIALAGLESSRARYAVACLALLAMLVLPATTVAWRIARGADPVVTSPALEAVTATEIHGGPEVRGPGRDGHRPVTAGEGSWLGAPLRSAAPWLTSIWALGIVVLSIRLAGGWARARAWARESGPVPDRWSRLCERIAARAGVVRRVRLRVSAEVAVPLAWGWLRPVVLLPASALAGMSSRDLEAVLAHELAHVRRHDHLVNLVQSVVETLLFHHPAVWWASRRVREEREHVCDEIAARTVGDRVAYARALTSLARTGARAPRVAMASTGGDLAARIRRVVAPEPRGRRRTAGPLAGVLALSLVALVPLAADRPAARAPDPGDRSRGEAVVRGVPPTTADADLRRRILERAEALAERDDVDVARQALDDEAWVVRAAGATALGFLGESRVAPSLVARLEDPAPRVREAAARALGQLNPTGAVEPLMRRVADDDPRVRIAAAWSLGFLGDDRATEALARASARDPDARVRRAASGALLML